MTILGIWQCLPQTASPPCFVVFVELAKLAVVDDVGGRERFGDDRCVAVVLTGVGDDGEARRLEAQAPPPAVEEVAREQNDMRTALHQIGGTHSVLDYHDNSWEVLYDGSSSSNMCTTRLVVDAFDVACWAMVNKECEEGRIKASRIKARARARHKSSKQ